MLSKPETAKTFVRLVIYTLLAVLCAWAIQMDAGNLTGDGRKFVENSYTEWMQVCFILLSSAFFILSGKQFAKLRPVSYLLGGGFLVILIREMDGYLDAIYHGAWLPFALVALAITLAVVYRHRQGFGESVRLFMSLPAFGYFVSGGLGFFVFSRLFGYKGIWMALFDVDKLDPYGPMRWVKSAAEEGTELFGYCLVFCATIELYSFVKRQMRPDTSHSPDIAS